MSATDAEQRDGSEFSPPPPRPATNVSAQKSIDKFWKTFTTRHPGKAFTVLPDDLYAKRAASQAARKPASSKNAVASYEHAVALCQAKVEKIVHDCRRLNQKYKDLHFDIEADFQQWQRTGWVQDCLVGLDEDNSDLRPLSVKRIEDIFLEPHFYIDGVAANDVRQGSSGDCWLMSAICTLSNKKGLLEKACVARDEQVGVYGFVFHRDGEWISEVIDDKLYLTKEDFHESFAEQYEWLTINIPSPDDEYRKVMQSGSKALYFAQCKDQNETWLPLLEKAYAKAHGDYGAISGGWVGEGLEDLTGGVTSELFAADILDKDKFWTDELMNVNKLFLFGLTQMGGLAGERSGIIEKHAYSIMEAKELDDIRLLKIRNPWGKKEWDGPWSDGSEQWTPDRMSRLGHTFGNDGVFWISYKDLLKNFQHIDRTRLFGPDWSVAQQWTSVNVPWSVSYLDTTFTVRISKTGPVVVVLSQLDDRYFTGLAGQYWFQLQFRIHREGEADYVARNNPSYFMYRSVTAELELEAGQYTIMIKVIASKRPSCKTPEEVIRKTCQNRPHKLMSIGLSYDLAHAKGRMKENELERQTRLRGERREEKKAMAKKAFEADRVVKKKEKLRRLRLEAKEAKSGKPAEAVNEETSPTKAGDSAPTVTGENGELLKNGTSDEFKLANPPPDGDQKKENATPDAAAPGTVAPEAAVPETRKVEKSAAEEVSKSEKPQEVVAQPGDQTGGDSTGVNGTKADADVPPVESKANADVQTVESKEKGDAPVVESLPVKNLILDDISDDGLSWSSDIDAPDLSSESDSDQDCGPPGPELSEPDDFAENPWNAVCVVGLRVYAKGSQAEIQVVRKPEASMGKEKPDVDDQAADAIKELQRSPTTPGGFPNMAGLLS